MNIVTKTFLAFIGLALLLAVNAYADDSPQQVRGKGNRTPPPEAYTACEGKASGDNSSFTSPRGHNVTGTCQEMDGRLFLRPDNPPPGQGGKRRK
jgi:hypothetical protein